MTIMSGFVRAKRGSNRFTMQRLGVVVSLGLVGPSAADEIEDVLDGAPNVVLAASSLDRDFLLLESTLRPQVKDHCSAGKECFESLMEAAKELASQRDPLASGDVKQNRRLKKAINKFVKLEKHLDRCDFSGYYTLASNYKGALNCPLLQSAVREAIQRHSDNCRKSYLEKFNDRAKRVDRNLVAKIDKMIDQRVQERVFEQNNLTKANTRSMDSVLLNNLWAPIRKADDLLLANIVASVEHSRYGKYFEKPAAGMELSKEQVANSRTKVYQRQLIKPCKRFVKVFSEIFYAAKLDLAAQTSENKSKLLAEMNPEQDQEFTNTWIKFRICQAIKQDLADILRRIGAEAEKQSGLSGQ